ncbi:SDR family NAD(P)-dependent oxidoreductase [Roseobacter sp.]|uniref:SDR family NAD(P)-dependent oxidoreductase n=1 Tax=Roseobacter sp. TaxID=1907202 RepID=UPI0029664549|nr:SDR family NAD(P)-dependent oxidoreductase [Roseobacter sp.]MDW3181565.1 SDR family NAD(P)-dependent oxidoreductase [Roseobacter sp.]
MKQIAVVTGGAQGIGLACARQFRDEGSAVALWDSDPAALEAAKAELGPEVVTCVVDVADFASVAAAQKETEETLGGITQLVNSAGIAGPNAVIEEYPLEDWGKILDVNLTGSFHVLRAVLPGMKTRGYGRIVLIASVAGKEGNPMASAYSASKAGVIGLTKSAGKECATLDIAVNCVTPAAAKTRIFDQMSEEHIAYMLSKIPRGRFLQVDEAAAMICWLCSAENGFATGGVFDLSGGRATY